MSFVPRIEVAGVGAWLVRLFEIIDEKNISWIMALKLECEAALGQALVDLVPSYTTLLVQYDPTQMQPDESRRIIESILMRLEPSDDEALGRIRELPVWYDPSVGPDLERICTQKSLSFNELVTLHTSKVYQVYALGFAPGFAFMGSVDRKIEMPRLETPRLRVAPGSVALAGQQTSAYPARSPGGWNLLGRTPITLFDRHRDEMSYFQVGDRVKLVSISRDEFIGLGGDPTPQETV